MAGVTEKDGAAERGERKNGKDEKDKKEEKEEKKNEEKENKEKNRKTYLCIDLKSFYASVECVERGLDPLTTNLAVADISRTEKTICLAVSPSLKAYGISGRARLFEVISRVREVNAERKRRAPARRLVGESSYDPEVQKNPSLALGFITAVPRMALYMEYSARVYSVYLEYVAPEDIHPYSIDEVFIDITGYLGGGKISPRDFAMKMIKAVLRETGITATAGIGTNMYLAKIAMDITAKHMTPDRDGVRIAELDEISYRKTLWSHRPLTDFWRVGAGYAKRLETVGIYTMGQIARCSLGKGNEYYNEELLYELFGVNAELLIDHAWGYEPCTMADVKAYRPETNSISSGQVLKTPYTFEKARLVLREMTELLVLDLVEKKLVTNQIVLTVGYDASSLAAGDGGGYDGDVTTDRYGRKTPKHAHGTANLERYTSSTRLITDATASLFDRIVDRGLLVRRITVAACRVIGEDEAMESEAPRQLDLFSDYESLKRESEKREKVFKKERQKQEVMIEIKKKYGKNAILKGHDLEQGATAIERNGQIGGHRK